MSLDITDNLFGIELRDNSLGYTLTIEKEPTRIPHEQAQFFIDHPLRRPNILVTGRDFNAYPLDARRIPPDPNKQYIEVGAGLLT
jgi:hypothetical protein